MREDGLRRAMTGVRQLVDRPTPAEGRWVAAPPKARDVLIDLVVLAASCAAVVAVVFQLWSVNLRLPYAYFGDGLYSLRDAVAMRQEGWVQSTPRLGFPFGQSMFDYPTSGDNGNYALMWIGVRITGDPALLINLLFLAGFFITAWVTYLALRWLRADRWCAVVGGLVFAFMPFHLLRQAHHFMLGLSYWVVAVGIVLAARAAAGDTVVPRRGERHGWRWLGWVAVCAVCGSFGAYYALMSAFTIGLAGVIGAMWWRRARPLLAGAQHVALIIGTLGVHLLPTVIARAHHGVNAEAVSRRAIEFDVYGLRLAQLLTPVPGHRLPPLEWLSDQLLQGYSSEPTQFLGMTASVGLVAMLLGLIRRARPAAAPGGSTDPTPLFAALALTWILVATTGGLNWVLSAFGFHLLRAWGRSSVLVGFLAIAWLAIAVTRWAATAQPKPMARTIVAVLLVAVAVFDQTSATIVPDNTAGEATYRSDQAFFARLEAELPDGAAVYQLPYRRFPETAPTVDSADYDLLRPYLHTSTLRWSYGGMKGRDADWQANLLDLAPTDLAEVVAAIGFDGVLIDRYGYRDRGAAVAAELTLLSGTQTEASDDGRWLFVPLTDLRAGLAADRAAELRARYLPPLEVHPVGCYPPEPTEDHRLSRWCERAGSLTIVNPQPDEPLEFRARVVPAAGTGMVTFEVDGETTTFDVDGGGTEIELELPEDPEVTVRFRTDLPPLFVADDHRDLVFQLVDLTILPPA